MTVYSRRDGSPHVMPKRRQTVDSVNTTHVQTGKLKDWRKGVLYCLEAQKRCECVFFQTMRDLKKYVHESTFKIVG